MRWNKEYFLSSVLLYDKQQLQDAQGIGGFILCLHGIYSCVCGYEYSYEMKLVTQRL